MSLFFTEQLGLPLFWSGIALGVAALLEIPALLMVGRLTERVSTRSLVGSGCIAGVGYYALVTSATEPVLVLAGQLLNAWFLAVVAGVGLTLFHEAIARPGLASGSYPNTRRVGAVVSGAMIGRRSDLLGYHGVFAACGVMTALAYVLLTRAVRPSASWTA